MNGEIYECGDGVPTSIIVPRTEFTVPRTEFTVPRTEITVPRTESVGVLAPAGLPEPGVTADAAVRRSALRGASIALTILGQLMITGLIAAGGDPVLGVVAAVAIVGCSLALIAAEAAGLQL